MGQYTNINWHYMQKHLQDYTLMISHDLDTGY